MEAHERLRLEQRCREARRLTLHAIAEVGSGHVGGSLSIIEALVTLYTRHLRVYPDDPHRPGRDRFVLSKGHAGPAYYAVLALQGFFGTDWLATLNKPGTRLPSHPDATKTPGVDMTTGSLGQGLSAATGMAVGSRLAGDGARVYAILGDGESQEGQVWEAAMWAAQQRLGNLIALTDYNDMNLDGPLSQINDLSPLDEKWRAFGWSTTVIDGHDLDAIDDALTSAEADGTRPTMIVLRTIKGKGVSSIEALGYANHHMPVSAELVREADRELADVVEAI